MTGRPQQWPVHDTMDVWMRHIEKRLLLEERRPIIRFASELLGPGIAQFAVPIVDWNSEETANNGIFVSEAGALNTPEGAGPAVNRWMGFSYCTTERNGVQQVWQVPQSGSPPVSYVRTFTGATGEMRTFSAWVASGGGGGGSGGSPTGPAGGDLSGFYPDPQIKADAVGSPEIANGAVGNTELAANAVTTDKIQDGTILAADLAAGVLGVAVQDENVGIATGVTTLDFQGAGVSALAVGGNEVVVTIPGGGGSGTAGPMPVGTVAQWVGNTPPTGWLDLSGPSYVNQFDGTVYPELAAALGDKYGVHSGNTYYLPDMRDRFPMGDSTTHPMNNVAGQGVGGSTTIAATNLPAHTHTVGTESVNHQHTFTAQNLGEFPHGGSFPAMTDINNMFGGGGAAQTVTVSQRPAGDAHTHAVTGGGSGAAYLQPYLALRFIIKAAPGGSGSGTGILQVLDESVVKVGSADKMNFIGAGVVAAQGVTGEAVVTIDGIPKGTAGGDLTGTYPNPTIGADKVTATHIANGAVGTTELADGNVTLAKLAANSVDASKIVDGSIANAELAANAVTTDKIADGTIVTGDLAAATVSALQPEVDDEGVSKVADTTVFDFVGAGVTVDSPSAGRARVTIPGGGGASQVVIPLPALPAGTWVAVPTAPIVGNKEFRLMGGNPREVFLDVQENQTVGGFLEVRSDFAFTAGQVNGYFIV